jgi:hypothetical protein
MDHFNNRETEFKSLRNRKISSQMKVSSAQMNLYLDDRMSSVEKKSLELKISECDISKSVFEKKKLEKSFIEQLIPAPTFSSTRREGLTRELADVGEAILIDSNINLTKKIVKFLKTPIL